MESVWIIFLQVKLDVLYLQLIITFVSYSLKWLLADIVDLIFEFLNDMSILLLTEDVVLLLVLFALLKLKLLLKGLTVDHVILFVECRPILSGNLHRYKTIKSITVSPSIEYLLMSLSAREPCGFLCLRSSEIWSHFEMKLRALFAPTSSSCLIPARIFDCFFGNTMDKW